MSDDKLRAAFNTHVANNAPSDRSACPSPEQLQTLAESGQGSNSTNLKMLDHVFGCAYCRADFALLRAVHTGVQSAQQADGYSTRKPSLVGRFSAPRIAIAATLLLAIGIGGESFRRSRAAVVRGDGGDTTDVVVVSPAAASVIAPDAAFVWHKVAGAVTYEVQLLDTTGVVIASHISADTVFNSSADARARIAAVPALDWFVSARRDDGNERRSAMIRVQVKR
ncbi:MAG: hypothetical protein ABI852_07970 [Gemmatimonadaceae bacterium]